MQFIQPTKSGTPAALSVDPRLIAANNAFGWRLLSLLARDEGDQNLFFSPAGLALVLHLVCNGAAGETLQAMKTALQLPDLALPDLNRANVTLLAQLHTLNPDVQIQLANALYVRGKERLKPEFVDIAAGEYQAGLGGLEEGAEMINAWVSGQTNGLIPTIVDEVEVAQCAALLLNAIYFKGSWKTPFPLLATQDQIFTQADGTQTSCRMMRVHGEFPFYQDAQWQAIRLPYGVGGVVMVVLLPAPELTVTDFVARLNADDWKTWMSRLQPGQGVVALPRFRVEFEAELSNALTGLGMGIAFDPLKADFSGMARRGLVIDQVKHRAFIEVNEAGTEAAAVTAVLMPRGIRAMKAPFTMVVDRPFICAIVEHSSDALLFLGLIHKTE